MLEYGIEFQWKADGGFMAVKFTGDRLRAIETLDKSILVSAAAGSGKTTILIERIKRIILNGDADVDQMLIVTFTKAAASEMRLRLAKAIRNHMKEHPEDNARMREQLNKLYKAYITTIDSFALRVVREFFYYINIEPDFSACDETQGDMLRMSAIEELFEDAFAEDDLIPGCGFREFLRLYSEERSENMIKAKMLKDYGALRTMPNYFNWAYEMAEQLNVTKDNLEGSVIYESMKEAANEAAEVAYTAACEVRKLLIDAGLEDLFEEKIANEINGIIELYEDLKENGFDIEIADRMDKIIHNKGKLNLKKPQKEPFQPIKDYVTTLRKTYTNAYKKYIECYPSSDLDTRFEEMNATYKYTVYYIRLLEEFEKRYALKKNEQRVMDFADMEHNAVKILENDEAANTLKKRFKFIFVDEYQDTNRIQEYLIGKVSRPNNAFKVGDLKQSIYRFRQAEPRLFQELYEEYSGENEAGIAIDLSKNFRTNDASIRYINKVFEEIMEGYDERARLNTGITENLDIPKEYDFIPEVHVLYDESESDSGDSYSYEDSDSEFANDSAYNSDNGVDEEIENLSAEEAEAAYIANLVSEIVGTEFLDTATGKVRKAEARDVAILFRSVKERGDIVARALRTKMLEAHVEETGDYFDTVEIGVALSLFTCIDNMKRDVPLISTLHSEIFNWSPDELAQVRIAHSEHLRDVRNEKNGASADATVHVRPAYWEALEWYINEGPDGALKEKSNKAVQSILEWRKLARVMPLEDYIWKVLTDSGYYMMAGAMNAGARRQANLRTLADRAGKYSRENIATLSSFISYLDVLRTQKLKSGQTSMVGSDDDVVRICTIHKSKGLEYPFVIVGGLGHRFVTDSIPKGFCFESSVGVAMSYIDPNRRFYRNTMMQTAINARQKKDGYKENLRVLYVAMTRARNKLILVGSIKKPETLEEYKPNPANFLEVIRNVIKTPYNRFFMRPLGSGISTGDKQTRIDTILESIPDSMTKDASKIYQEIDKRFTYEYPDADLLTAKAKYSVSELRREEVEKATAPVRLTNRSGKKDDPAKSHNVSAAEVGTAYHRILEFVDFGRAIKSDGSVDRTYIDERIEHLAKNGAFEEDIYKAIDPERIEAFFKSEIGIRAVSAAGRGTLMKEKPFTLRTSREGRDILVQGVIDCCFEEDGKMILVDYKTSFIRPWKNYQEEVRRIEAEYKPQIDLYAEAIKKGTGMDVSEAYLYLFSSGEAVGF